MALISDEVSDALVTQWSEEVYNAHLYLTIEIFLRKQGLDKIADLFKGQWEEEQEHARIIQTLLTDLDAVYRVPAIRGCEGAVLANLMDIASLYLRREVITTQSLEAIRAMAQSAPDSGCPVVEQRMREMIILQQAELAEATTFMDKASKIGDDWSLAVVWDASL